MCFRTLARPKFTMARLGDLIDFYISICRQILCVQRVWMITPYLSQYNRIFVFFFPSGFPKNMRIKKYAVYNGSYPAVVGIEVRWDTTSV